MSYQNRKLLRQTFERVQTKYLEHQGVSELVSQRFPTKLYAENAENNDIEKINRTNRERRVYLKTLLL